MKNIQLIRVVMMSLFFVGLSAEAESVPPEISNLQVRRNHEIDKVNGVYLKELEKLKIKYTKRGDLDNANLVVRLMKKVEVVKVDEVFLLDGKWRYQLKRNKPATRVFKGKIMINESGKKFSVKIDGDLVRVKFSRRGWEFLYLNPNRPDVINGVNSNGEMCKYTRLK